MVKTERNEKQRGREGRIWGGQGTVRKGQGVEAQKNKEKKTRGDKYTNRSKYHQKVTGGRNRIGEGK